MRVLFVRDFYLSWQERESCNGDWTWCREKENKLGFMSDSLLSHSLAATVKERIAFSSKEK